MPFLKGMTVIQSNSLIKQESPDQSPNTGTTQSFLPGNVFFPPFVCVQSSDEKVSHFILRCQNISNFFVGLGLNNNVQFSVCYTHVFLCSTLKGESIDGMLNVNLLCSHIITVNKNRTHGRVLSITGCQMSQTVLTMFLFCVIDVNLYAGFT